MDSRRLQQFHFTVCGIMIIITAFFVLLKLRAISLISLMNQKREQQTILNGIWCDSCRTIRKIRLTKRKNFNQKELACKRENLNEKNKLVGIKLVGVFKENTDKIFWGCLLLPVWNAVDNARWKMVVLLLVWVGKCCSELGT